MTDTIAEFMGVRVDHVAGPLNAELKPIMDAPLMPGKVAAGKGGYTLSAKLDNAYMAVNQLQAKGMTVSRIDAAAPGLVQGDFVVSAGLRRASRRLRRRPAWTSTRWQACRRVGRMS